MICKPIVIKRKRSRSSFLNTIDKNKTRSRHSCSNLNQQDWQNSLLSLNKILNHLNDDTIKKYNTQIDRYADLNQHSPVNNDTNAFKNSCPKNYLQIRTSTKFQTLEPEPWFNDNDKKKWQKSSKTNNILSAQHFQLPKDWQQTNQNLKSIRSSINRKKFITQPDEVKSQRIKKIEKLLQQNQALWTQNFTYSNQQKAKVSIEYLLHQQKHKKMEKILKYKRNFIQKPVFQKQKINQHSKYLVDMLKKLSKDNLFAQNIISSQHQEKNKRFSKPKTISKKSQFQILEPDKKQSSKKQIKSTSCCDLINANQTETQNFRGKFKPKCSIKEISADFNHQLGNKQIHNYKMTLKPKRNLIFEKRSSSYSQRNLNPYEIRPIRKFSEKQFAVTNHFLKIKKVKS